MVNHSKYKRCGSVFNVIDLKDNPDGVGKVCKNETVCQEKQKKVVAEVERDT